MDDTAFKIIVEFLEKVPSIQKPISTGEEDGFWWIKFSIDIT